MFMKDCGGLDAIREGRVSLINFPKQILWGPVSLPLGGLASFTG